MRASPFPQFRTATQPRIYGIPFDIASDPRFFSAVSNQAVVVFGIPERETCTIQDSVGQFRRGTFQIAHDSPQLPARANHDVDVVCHNYPGAEFVIRTVLPEHEYVADQVCDHWALQPERSTLGSVQVLVSLRENCTVRIPARRAFAQRGSFCKLPGHEKGAVRRLDVRQVPSIFGSQICKWNRSGFSLISRPWPGPQCSDF